MTTNAKVHRSVSRPKGSNRRRKGPRNWKPFLWRWGLRVAVVVLVAIIIGGCALAIFLGPFYSAAAGRDLSRLDTKRFPVPQATVVVDSKGTELGRIFIENREWVAYEEVPEDFVNALVASEDQRFWQHEGVDLWGIARAAVKNVMSDGPKSGASTLTQQLARGVFSLADAYADDEGSEQPYRRKVEEIFLAQRIEKHLKGDKEEIVEQYVNRIYFGHGCYGVSSAAHHYFDKSTSELSLLECTSLVGLIPSPNRLNPVEDPEENIRVRNNVLVRMRSDGYIDRDTERAARSEPLPLHLRRISSPYGHLFGAIRTRVSDLIGWDQASQGGYLVETSVDLDLQRYAEEQLKATLNEIEQRKGYDHPLYADSSAGGNYLEGSVMMIDTQTGGVLAMVGGRDFSRSEFNYATQARKPAGSAFMPVVYARAFTAEGGYSPISLIEDSPIDLRRVQVGGLEGIMGEWGMELPAGDPNLVFEGPLPARRCLEMGKLAATVRLGERVGLSNVAQTARNLGVNIPTGKPLYNRLLIGENDETWPGITGEEYARMYGVFSRSGEEVPPTELITKITRPDGTVVYTAPTPPPPRPVIDPIAAWQVRSCLNGVLTEGVNHQIGAQFPELDLSELIGHSGTTHNWTDAWFVGANPRVACVVWAGFDTRQGAILKGGSGGELLMPLWGKLMQRVENRAGSRRPKAPSGTRPVEICRVSGGLAGEGCYEDVPTADGGIRFVRTSYVEDLRYDTDLPPACSIHPSEAPLDRILDDPSEGTPIFDQRIYSQIKPSLPTIVGEDPYQSVPGLVRAEASETSNQGDDDEQEAIEPVDVDAIEPAPLEPGVIEPTPIEPTIAPLPPDLPFSDPEPSDLIHVGE